MSDSNQLRDVAAVAGIGATEFSKESGRSELRLAVEAFVFFKQKTAYEMVSCDWSSDVCSSDLPRRDPQERQDPPRRAQPSRRHHDDDRQDRKSVV